MDYPDKNDIVELLLEAARVAAQSTTAVHPEDIAVAMSVAIDNSWPVITLAYKRFKA